VNTTPRFARDWSCVLILDANDEKYNSGAPQEQEMIEGAGMVVPFSVSGEEATVRIVEKDSNVLGAIYKRIVK